MRFDQVRREYKKTLWGEELDNEGYGVPTCYTLDLDFLHQYEGKKYQCPFCLHVYVENEMILLEYGRVCHDCFLVEDSISDRT